MKLKPTELYQFRDCHPVNPLTGDVVTCVLMWFTVLYDGSLWPTPRIDGPHRNCSRIPDLDDVVNPRPMPEEHDA